MPSPCVTLRVRSWSACIPSSKAPRGRRPGGSVGRGRRVGVWPGPSVRVKAGNARAHFSELEGSRWDDAHPRPLYASREPSYMEWRYVNCPLQHYEKRQLRSGPELVGFLVYHLYAEQGVRYGVLDECFSLEVGPGLGGFLVLHDRRHAVLVVPRGRGLGAAMTRTEPFAPSLQMCATRRGRRSTATWGPMPGSYRGAATPSATTASSWRRARSPT